MSAEDTARTVLSKVGVWWPAADEGQVRAAADAWRAMAGALDDAAAAGGSTAGRVEGVYRGAAADGFQAFWQRYGGGGGYVPQASQACRELATMCDRYADAISQAKSKLVELAAEIGATVVVGTALAIFTFGASEAAAAAASASLVAAAGLVEGTVAATIAEIAATAATYAVIGAVEGAALDVAVAQPVRVGAFHDGGFSLDEVETSALGGAAAGGLLAGGRGALSAVRAARAVAPAIEAPVEGMPVWRVHGEAQDLFGGMERGSRPGGASWTPKDPRLSSDFRVDAGLPDENPGRFLTEGRLLDPGKVTDVRPALPLDGNPGGWPEYLIDDADAAVQVTGVSGVNEPWTRASGSWAPPQAVR